MNIFKKIHDGNVPLEDVEKEQRELKRYLGRINQRDPKIKSEKTKKGNK